MQRAEEIQNSRLLTIMLEGMDRWICKGQDRSDAWLGGLWYNRYLLLIITRIVPAEIMTATRLLSRSTIGGRRPEC